MNPSDDAIAKACCAELYQSDLARLVLGDSLHPGGLALTNRLGRLMDIEPDDWVVDLASGRGASATAVARVFHCKVVGIEFGSSAVSEARASCRQAPISSDTFFVRGDAEEPPIAHNSVDAVFCECSLSIFPNKPAVVEQVKGMIRPGGRFGLSDITLEPGSLPEEFNNILGQVFCLTHALSVSGYLDLLVQSGMALTNREDASAEITRLLDELEGTLAMLMAGQNIIQQDIDTKKDWLQHAPALLHKVRQLVSDGKLGYWLFVAKKPD